MFKAVLLSLFKAGYKLDLPASTQWPFQARICLHGSRGEQWWGLKQARVPRMLNSGTTLTG